MREGIFIYELHEEKPVLQRDSKGSLDGEKAVGQERGAGTFAVITGLAGARRHLQVPAFLGGAPVRQIAPHAFREQAHLQSLSLPQGIVSVGAFALHKCPELTEVTLHDGILDFHNGVLRQDLKLRRIHLYVHAGNYTVMRDILSDSDARFQFCLHLPDGEARLLFPGYDYAFAENTMARTIQFSISGSGMVYRECVRRKGINFREYDRLFPRVIPDDSQAAARIAADRLLFPYDLAQVHARVYETYLRENAQEALIQFVGESQADPESGFLHLHLMADRGMITGPAADAALRIAARQKLPDVSSIILAGREKTAGKNRDPQKQDSREGFPDLSADPFAAGGPQAGRDLPDEAERRRKAAGSASAKRLVEAEKAPAGESFPVSGTQAADGQGQGKEHSTGQDQWISGNTYNVKERQGKEHSSGQDQSRPVPLPGALVLEDW